MAQRPCQMEQAKKEERGNQKMMDNDVRDLLFSREIDQDFTMENEARELVGREEKGALGKAGYS